MIAILSPAKTIDMSCRIVSFSSEHNPVFLEEAAELMKGLQQYTPPELESLMKVNSKLAEQNFFRHLQWEKVQDKNSARQAILAYHGAVYQGLDAASLRSKDLHFANKQVRILSGLYGVLRPLDLIQPYRLEMATKPHGFGREGLYGYWRDKLTHYFCELLSCERSPVLLNLASKEYSDAIHLQHLPAVVITPVFKDYKNGSYKNITIYAKRARGLLCRYMIEHRIENPEELKHFSKEDYRFDPSRSSEFEWVFLR